MATRRRVDGWPVLVVVVVGVGGRSNEGSCMRVTEMHSMTDRAPERSKPHEKMHAKNQKTRKPPIEGYK